MGERLFINIPFTSMFVKRMEVLEYRKKFEIELTRGVLQLSALDFHEIFRTAR